MDGFLTVPELQGRVQQHLHVVGPMLIDLRQGVVMRKCDAAPVEDFSVPSFIETAQRGRAFFRSLLPVGTFVPYEEIFSQLWSGEVPSEKLHVRLRSHSRKARADASYRQSSYVVECNPGIGIGLFEKNRTRPYLIRLRRIEVRLFRALLDQPNEFVPHHILAPKLFGQNAEKMEEVHNRISTDVKRLRKQLRRFGWASHIRSGVHCYGLFEMPGA